MLTSFSFSMSLNCLTRVSSGTRARSRAARTSASMAASLPMSFFFSFSFDVAAAVAGVVVAAVADADATVLSDTASAFVLSALSPSAASEIFNFLLFRASFSPLDSETLRLLAAAAASSVFVGSAAK